MTAGNQPPHHPERVARDGLCSGCGACRYASPTKIEMRLDDAGYLRPVTRDVLTASELDTVKAICPGIGLEHPPESLLPAGTRYDVLWGPVAGIWTGHANDAEVRFAGSSGGVLSAVLIHLLESGKVDFVLQTRASNADPLGNETVLSRTREDVLSGAGSRYSPAAPVASLPEALATPGRFAFVGKPCDVAAVRKLLHRQPDLNDRIPYLLSFMCAGTPSRKGATDVVAAMGLKAEEVVRFRFRGNGWPGMARAETKLGAIGEMDYNQSWGTILNRSLQRRCKLCADGTGEFADFVAADAWYGVDGYPDFEEREGRSLAITRNPKGATLVESVELSNGISLNRCERDDVRQMQPFQFNRKTTLLARMIALSLLLQRRPNYRRLRLGRAMLANSFARSVRSGVGAFLRQIQGRL
jgi:coenzyme F420 hydrogenase subunit beta